MSRWSKPYRIFNFDINLYKWDCLDKNKNWFVEVYDAETNEFRMSKFFAEKSEAMEYILHFAEREEW